MDESGRCLRWYREGAVSYYTLLRYSFNKKTNIIYLYDFLRNPAAGLKSLVS